MQNELGYAIWGLRGTDDLILLKKHLLPEVESTLTDIRTLTRSHTDGNDYLYLVAKSVNYNILCIINTKTIDHLDRESFIGISLFFTNNYALNTSAIPYLEKAMAFYLKMQTIAKSENMFSDEMFIEQFQGINLVASNSYQNYHTPKQGCIRFNNINEIQDYFIYKNLPSNYTRVYFIKEGNGIDFEGNQIEEIKPNTIIAGPQPTPEWPPISEPRIISDPPPINWTKKIGILIISIGAIVTLAILSYKKYDNKQTIVCATDTTAQKDSIVNEDTQKVEETTPTDPIENPTGQQQMNGSKFHIVADGEDLGKISTKTGKYIKELKSLNKQIKNFNDLHKGDTIWLEEKKTVKNSGQGGDGQKPREIPKSNNDCTNKCSQLKQKRADQAQDQENQERQSDITKLETETKNCECPK